MKTKITILAAMSFLAAACPATTPNIPPPGATIPIAYPVIQVDSIDVMIEYYTKMESIYRSHVNQRYPESQISVYMRGKAELCRQVVAELKEARRDVFQVVLPIVPPFVGPIQSPVK